MTSASPALPIEGLPEETAVGRYVLVRELGSGGMATVYLGSERGLVERPVAIKRLHPHLAKDPQFVEMLLDEARIAARIVHPNVCVVHDFGEEHGTYYIAMEYLSGVSLRRIARGFRNGAMLAPNLVAWIAHEVAEGLQAAHETRGPNGESLEIVHRDISPDNVVVTFDGAVKVVDFGIARAHNRLQLTRQRSLKGKIAYMAPEYAAAEGAIDRRADIWALGVVTWELLTGHRLFRKSTEMNTMLAVASMPVPAPSQVRPSIPPALDAVVLRALERDVDRRYGTARDLSRDLAAYLRDAPASKIDLSEWLRAHFAEEREIDAQRMRDLASHASIRLPATPTASALVDMQPTAQTQLADRGTDEEPTETDRRPAARWPRVLVMGAVLLAAASVGAWAALPSAGGSGAADALPARVAAEQPADRAIAPRAAVPVRPSPEPVVEEQAAAEPERAAGDPTDPPSARDARRARRVRRAHRARASRGVHEVAEPAATGRLSVVTVGGYADVYDGNVHLGQTPINEREIRAGAHRLRVVPSGGRPERTVPVRVASGQTKRVSIDLLRAPR